MRPSYDSSKFTPIFSSFSHKPFSIRPLHSSLFSFVRAKPLENCKTYVATIPIFKDTTSSAHALGYVNLNFFRVPVVALLDTGASISGMPYHLYNKLKEIGIFSSDKKYKKYELKQSQHSKNAIAFYSNKRNAQNHIEQISDQFELCLKVNGIDTRDHSCFGYNLNKCKGACIGEELSYDYNERFDESIQYINRVFEKDFIILERGRNPEEKSVTLVHEGHFRAYGHIENEIGIESVDQLKTYLTEMPINPDADRLIRNYIWNTPDLEIHYI